MKFGLIKINFFFILYFYYAGYTHHLTHLFLFIIYFKNKHQPQNIMMFDFQTLRYSSPMVDLGTFFANSTGYEVRSKHFDEIFKAYHDKLLDVYCRKMDIKPDCVPDYFR
jgi:hypothetical protein